ncbi:hypothetical protein RhiirC2_783249 [Rhizophagus irregularis]|uniref:RNase H type-1 domain-containing protein n=1 Tax=Rhizophagus irregularis TaxID=588596 RepID=A0A2N1N170_9GLOM|nr:hypothetical protein RhiirC2_783249 [Rhizophagus irregularis]
MIRCRAVQLRLAIHDNIFEHESQLLFLGAITHIDWYYMVDLVNRVENITTNINIQQMEKTPTIELRSLKNIEYYTDGSLANQTINTNYHSHNMADNTIVNLGAVFYTNNEEGKYSVYSSLSFWPSSIRAEIVAIFLALLKY